MHFLTALRAKSPKSRFLTLLLVRALNLACRWLLSHNVFTWPFLGSCARQEKKQALWCLLM